MAGPCIVVPLKKSYSIPAGTCITASQVNCELVDNCTVKDYHPVRYLPYQWPFRATGGRGKNSLKIRCLEA